MSKYYKHPQYGMVFGEAIATPAVRVVWPYLTKPKDPPPPKEGQAPGQPRYEVTFLFENGKETEAFFASVKKMTDEMIALFNDKRSAKIGQCALYKDGNDFDHEKYPYYKDRLIAVGRNAQKPKVVDVSKQAISDELIVGGLLCRAVVIPLVTAHGVSYKLDTLQLFKDDGVRIGGGKKDNLGLLDACSDDTAEESSDSETSEASDKEVSEKVEPAKAAKKGKAAAVNML